MDVEVNFPVVQSSDPMFDVASLHIVEEDYLFDARRRAAGFLTPSASTTASVLNNYRRKHQDNITANKMLAAEYLTNILDMMGPHPDATGDVHKGVVFDGGARINVMHTLNATESSAFVPELFYRHSMAMTAVYCVAYLLVFAVGIVGNFFVIAVVFRSPRMRTVTNFFIVNLAVADILVIVFCLPATLMSNIFVRK